VGLDTFVEAAKRLHALRSETGQFGFPNNDGVGEHPWPPHELPEDSSSSHPARPRARGFRRRAGARLRGSRRGRAARAAAQAERGSTPERQDKKRLSPDGGETAYSLAHQAKLP